MNNTLNFRQYKIVLYEKGITFCVSRCLYHVVNVCKWKSCISYLTSINYLFAPAYRLLIGTVIKAARGNCGVDC